MNIQEARIIGDRLAGLIAAGKITDADEILSPILNEKTPFPILGGIGTRLGMGPIKFIDNYLDNIAAKGTMGGWVVIASALRSKIPDDLPGLFDRSRKYTLLADTWYGVDIFGERVPGPALVAQFDASIELLKSWRGDQSRWIRRMVGMAVHYWTKQAHGKEQFKSQVITLLDLFTPMYSEKEYDAVKGVGWGLKTLGRFYPDIMADWLVRQNRKPHTALMFRKATTFLPADLRERAMRKSE